MTFQVAEPRPTTGRTSHSGSGSSTASPTKPSRISWSSCRPSPQGASCRSCAVSRTEPAVEGPGVAKRAQRLDRRGDAPLHVRRPAAGEQAVLDRGRDERQVDRVEVAVELERPARPSAREPDHHGRGRGIAALGPLDREPVGGEDLGQPVAGRPASPVRLGTSTSRTAVSTSRSRWM